MAATHPDLWLDPVNGREPHPQADSWGRGRQAQRAQSGARAVLRLDGLPAVSALAANKDGIDGKMGLVTDRAGTVANAGTPSALDAQRRLDESAATGYLQVTRGRIVRGALQRNVTDFRVILVDA
jgi:glycerate-2-kinase